MVIPSRDEGVPAGKRKCRICGLAKPRDEFYPGQGNTCKRCNNAATRARRKADPIKHRATRRQWEKRNAVSRRATRLRRRYKITLKQVEVLWRTQGGICLVCQVPLIPSWLPDEETTGMDGEMIVVDHCHKCGKVRGLLCTPCNVGLGYFRDSLKLIKAAFYYVKSHKE